MLINLAKNTQIHSKFGTEHPTGKITHKLK